MTRTILHLDMDAFYASVEQGDRPQLRGRPVIVGGSPERGVVCACSYEARPYGVRSAMAMAQAIRLCPRAVVLPVRMERYREVSRNVFEVFSRFTDRVEPLSIDEAFLDVTGCERLFGEPRAIAARIKAEVRAATALTVSAGVAPNKFLAKLASDFGKPDGLVEVRPGEVDEFLLPLPLSRLWGVGRVTAGELERRGLRTVADVRRLGRQHLKQLLGSAGEHLYRLCRGEDDRPVAATEAVKSVGHEETYPFDLWDRQELRRELLALSEKVSRRLRRLELVGRCVTLKLKYADFAITTRSRTVTAGLDHAPTIYREALSLLEKTEAGRRPVRLLGISASLLEARESGQVEMFGEEQRLRMKNLDRAVDRLRDRYGELGIQRAALLEGPDSKSQKGGDSGEGA
jgi:DNA polymerase-4